MSSDSTVIRVSEAGKCYEMYRKASHRLWQALSREHGKFFDEFWALRDISFDVKQGECVGILGNNGSGKSTLLQLIAGTLALTTGRIQVEGRIAALLELGSGFSPEFTGRENVFMNGAILGFSRREVKDRFDRIAAFADIGDFIDRPVKIYSSGMMLRLAFAVQVQVEPDILIIDEALAVGDAKFQQKCFRQIEMLRRRGTTVIFVTHDISTVKSFCNRAILLNHGEVIGIGDPRDVAVQYFSLLFPDPSKVAALGASDESPATGSNGESTDPAETSTQDTEGLTVVPKTAHAQCFGVGGATIEKVRVVGLKNNSLCNGGEKITIEMTCLWNPDTVKELINSNVLEDNLIIGASISNVKGTYLFGFATLGKDIRISTEGGQRCVVSFGFTMPRMVSGDYFMNFAVALGEQENHIQLRWHDALIHFTMDSGRTTVYGLLYRDFEASMKKLPNNSD